MVETTMVVLVLSAARVTESAVPTSRMVAAPSFSSSAIR